MQVDNLENEGGVFPFAQDDMVHTILSGVDREYEIFSKTFLNEAFHTYPIELLSIIRQNIEITDEQEATLEELFSSSSKELFKKYNEETNRYLIRHHVSPIFNTIEILPKEELASIAETLVNITSFKRKISAAAETVGGPVDVALITKGDGFIWIKRKHYFDPQLNHHFFDNYYRRG